MLTILGKVLGPELANKYSYSWPIITLNLQVECVEYVASYSSQPLFEKLRMGLVNYGAEYGVFRLTWPKQSTSLRRSGWHYSLLPYAQIINVKPRSEFWGRWPFMGILSASRLYLGILVVSRVYTGYLHRDCGTILGANLLSPAVVGAQYMCPYQWLREGMPKLRGARAWDCKS